MEVKIIIPSKGRAKDVTTTSLCSHTCLCVAESEAEEYAKHNPGIEIITHPDDVKGIGMKRQWIYDHYGNVFMLDDDLVGMEYMGAKKGERGMRKPDEAYYLIQNAANIAKLTGCYLFGFNNIVQPRHFVDHRPFKMTGFVNGCAMGLLEGAVHIRFNPKLRTSHDFYISALNAHFYRKAFIDERYVWKQLGIGKTTGGAAGLRTNENEEEDMKLLKRYFGSAIQRQKNANRLKFSKYLKVPF